MSANTIQGEIPSTIAVLTVMAGDIKVVTSSSIRWSKAFGAIRPKAVDSFPLSAGTVVAGRRGLESWRRFAQAPLLIVIPFAGSSAARASAVLPGVDRPLGTATSEMGYGNDGVPATCRAIARPGRLPLRPAAPEANQPHDRPPSSPPNLICGLPLHRFS
jgi:hypothetical protein